MGEGVCISHYAPMLNHMLDRPGHWTLCGPTCVALLCSLTNTFRKLWISELVQQMFKAQLILRAKCLTGRVKLEKICWRTGQTNIFLLPCLDLWGWYRLQVDKVRTANYIWSHRNTIECVATVISFCSSKQSLKLHELSINKLAYIPKS